MHVAKRKLTNISNPVLTAQAKRGVFRLPNGVDPRLFRPKRMTGAPGIPFGHVIDLPHFGKIFLGELTVTRELGKPATAKSNNAEPDTYLFHLTMIRLELGCIAQGNSSIVMADANGKGKP